MNSTEPRINRRHYGFTLGEAVRHRLMARRAARAARRRLESDLATFTTQADLDDLYAVLDRYPDADTAPIREILTRRRIPVA